MYFGEFNISKNCFHDEYDRYEGKWAKWEIENRWGERDAFIEKVRSVKFIFNEPFAKLHDAPTRSFTEPCRVQLANEAAKNTIERERERELGES